MPDTTFRCTLPGGVHPSPHLPGSVQAGDEDISLLASIPYFQEVSHTDLVELAAHCRRLRVNTGEMVFIEGDPCAGLCYLISGRVKATRYSPQGRELVIREFTSDETFNEVGALESGINPATAVAMVDNTEILIIPSVHLCRLLVKYPHSDVRMMQGLAGKLHFAMAKMSRLALLDVRSRLVAYLLEHADEAGCIGPMSQEELASILGSVRQVIGRTLTDLQRSGLIKVKRAQIKIVDAERLKTLVES